MDRKQIAEIASAIFAAQNELTDLWHVHNHEGGDKDQERVDAVQEQLRSAIRILGGVDYLLEIGA